MKKNIIITGGGLVNKGAQAMTFIAVSELKKRFPNHQIFVLSPEDLKRPVEELKQYDFEFIGWYPQKFAKCQHDFFLRMVCMLRNKTELEEAEKIYRNTDLMIDISGYALGSGWSEKICNDYLDNLQFAKSFNIPVYLFPQSFGPFDFQKRGMDKVDQRVRQILPSVKLICAREQEGYDALKESYCLNNTTLLPDIVLNNKGIDIKSVYKKEPQFCLPEIVPNSVALIPNSQNFTVNEKDEVMWVYAKAIEYILQRGKAVYLLHHSSLDLNICKELKQLFLTEDKVILLEKDYSCLEFNEIVKKFEYMVASRFHSIVHAYKSGIPCITIGWAEKYEVLLAQFEQKDYWIDVRDDNNEYKVIDAIKQMEKQSQTESEKIKLHIKSVQEENIFDILEL